MKRIICIFICILLTFSIASCGMKGKNDFLFYYRNAELRFGDDEGVMKAEKRDILGHEGDTAYIVALYLAGPLDEDLVSPFHKSTRLLSVHSEGDSLLIRLTDSGLYTLDSEFSLACACLAMTCMEIPGVDRVTIENRDRVISMSRENITLYDSMAESSASEDEK